MNGACLALRRFADRDAERVTTLAGDVEVARMTGNIPHPYPEGEAAAWFVRTRAMEVDGLLIVRAVEVGADGVVGCVSLKRRAPGLREAEIAYWIGRPFWGRGLATEACRALIEIGVSNWKLDTVWGGILPDNARSQRVLTKLGMTREGRYQVQRPGRQGAIDLLRFGGPTRGQGS